MDPPHHFHLCGSECRTDPPHFNNSIWERASFGPPIYQQHLRERASNGPPCKITMARASTGPPSLLFFIIIGVCVLWTPQQLQTKQTAYISSLTSALLWWFIKVQTMIVACAAEFRRTHPSRPPPEPDSKPFKLRFIVALMCIWPVKSSPTNFTHLSAISFHHKMSHTQRDPPQAPFRGNPRDDETIWSMNDDLAGLTVGGSTTAGIGGLSLGEEFDGETQPPLYEFDDETNPSVDPKVKKTEKKSNVGRRVSVDPDGLSSVDSSADLPRYPRVPSPRVKPPRAPTPPPAQKPPPPPPKTMTRIWRK